MLRSRCLWMLCAASLAACSSGNTAPAGGGIVPAPNAARAPFAAATPPVTAPVTIPYALANAWTTTTWSGPNAKPKIVNGSEKGTITVKFRLDAKTGLYFVPETVVSNQGYTEQLNSAIGFLPLKSGGIGQIVLSDNFTYVQGSLKETGLDTYPQGQNSIDFPLRKGRSWKAAAAHLSSFNATVASGPYAFQEISATNEAADGTYTNQASFSSTQGSKNQDNYASTTMLSLAGPSTYTFSAPAGKYNPLTQTFALPQGGRIAVTTSGKPPIPAKAGTVRVRDWYQTSGGALPNPLYADNWVVKGKASMPSDCGKRAGSASTHVLESSYTVDPVQGISDSYTADYYMDALATGQYWFACIVEAYDNATYANGWFMSAGHWGKPSSEQVGKEVLIASGAKPSAQDLRGLSALQALLVRPVVIRYPAVADPQAPARSLSP